MLKKSLIFLFVFLMSLSLFAKAQVYVSPAIGEGSEASSMSKSLSKELKSLYKTVEKEADVKLSDLDSSVASKIKRCGVDPKCVSKEIKTYKKAPYVFVPIVKSSEEGIKVTLVIFNAAGKSAAKQAVTVDSDTDAEDLASEVAGKLIKACGSLGSEEDGGDEEDEEVSAKSEKAPAAMSESDRKKVLRNAFKAYKAGKGQEASKLFKEAGNSTLADTADAVVMALEDSKTLMKNGDAARAVETIAKVEKKDMILREQGYKELQFIKETNKKVQYLEPEEADYTKVRKLFRSVKEEMKSISSWRDGELAKLEKSMDGKLDEQQRINDAFEASESKKLKDEKKMEKDHQKKIEDLRSNIENLDNKYRDKLKDIDREIEKLNKKLEDERPAEEIYKEDIDKEIEEIGKKYKKDRLELKKQLVMAQKQSKADIEAAEKESEEKLAALEQSNSDLEKQIKKLSREIENMASKFDAAEQKEDENANKEIAAAEAQDSKERDAAEKKANDTAESLNKQLEDYDKNITKIAEKVDKIDREISDYNDKQEQRLSKNQEGLDKKREANERDFESKRSVAEEKAEQAYQKGQAERAKKIETLESAVIKIEDSKENYEKDPQWKKAKQDLKAATDDLVKYEDGHDKFIDKETASVTSEYKAAQAKVDAEQKGFEGKIKKESAAFRTKKDTEKKSLEAEMKRLEKGKSAFEKDTQAKIKAAETEKDKKLKEIDGRMAKREQARDAKAKQRKAQFDKEAAAKRKQLADLEKKQEASDANNDKQRDAIAQQLESKRAAAEKKLNEIEVATENKKSASEDAEEKEKQAVYAKYEKKAETDKAEITKKIAKLEAGSKTFISQRGKEEATLRANLDAAEKKTDTMKDGWEKDAAKRKAAHEANLKAAESREKAAKAKYEQSKKTIEAQYKSKVDALIKSKSVAAGGKDFKEERDRNFEYSAYTKQLNAAKADALASQGMDALKDEKLADARKFFFDALYANAESKSALNGLKEIEKTAGAMYDRAYASVQSGDTDSAKKILKTLKKDLSPKSEHYLKVLALLEDMKDSKDSDD